MSDGSNNFWVAVGAIGTVAGAIFAYMAWQREEAPTTSVREPPIVEQPPVFDPARSGLTYVEVGEARPGATVYATLMFVGNDPSVRACRSEECLHLEQAIRSVDRNEHLPIEAAVVFSDIASSDGIAGFPIPAAISIGDQQFDVDTSELRVGISTSDVRRVGIITPRGPTVRIRAPT